MCAASLKNGGPCLISHCLCEWIVNKQFSHEIVSKLSIGSDEVTGKWLY